MYNEKTGKFDGISTAYRIKLTSAYVVDPDQPMGIPKLAADEWRLQAFQAIKTNTIKAVETKIPQAVPPGTSEAAVPSMEHDMADLPSRDYFLKTLVRPHYEGDDANGYPVWERQRRASPASPQQQVRNEAAKP